MYASRTSFLAALFMFPAIAATQDSDIVTPQPEHKLLRRFAGEWEFVKRSVPPDGRSNIVGRGQVSARMIGEFFVLGEWKGELYGMKFEAVQTFGYSVQKKRYVGTWIDSIISHQWQIEGPAEQSDDRLTASTKGPGPDGQLGEFRETYDFKSENEIVAIAEMKQGDKWHQFMTTEFKRKKSVNTERTKPSED